MEKSNLIHREVFAEVPPRVEYSLTDTGWSLKPILDSMFQWGNNYREMQKYQYIKLLFRFMICNLALTYSKSLCILFLLYLYLYFRL